MTDEQPTRWQRIWAEASSSLRATASMVVPVGSVVLFVVLTSDDDKIKAQLAVSVAVALVVGALTAFFFGDRESPEVKASRERVREAERDVEGALRGALTRLEGKGYVQRGDAMTPSRPQQTEEPVGGPEAPQRAEDAVSQQERRDLALSTLWKLTHAQLELYHGIATSQAKRSFSTAQFAMLAGFGMLGTFVYLALKVSNTTGAIVAGGLGAVSAGLAGFISKTFVKSQQTAAEHLRTYFDQPLEFSRYLAAERLLADANLPEEQRAEVVAALVQTVAAGPGGPAPAADPRALLEQLQDLAPGQQ